MATQEDRIRQLIGRMQGVDPRLKSAFDKYLPAVIDGKTPEKKAIITEGKEVTGNRETHDSDNARQSNVIDIQRLAGLK